MRKKNKKNPLAKMFINMLTTVGVCAAAYMILAILSNYGKSPKKSSPINLDKHFKEKKADKIIEAKIET